MIYAPGVTSQSVDVQIVDDTGLPVTGLVASSFPALTYSIAGANSDAAISLSDLATITTAWASGGVKERGGGVYRLDVPNAVFSSAGVVTIRGEATNKRLVLPKIEVVRVDVGKVSGTDQTAGDIVDILADIQAKTDLIGTASALISSPMTASGAIEFVIGDDYLTVDGRQLDFTDATWPSLTGGTVSLYFKNDSGSYSANTTAVSPLDADSARIQLTKAFTTAFSSYPGHGTYSLKATLSNASVVTLKFGTYTAKVRP